MRSEHSKSENTKTYENKIKIFQISKKTKSCTLRYYMNTKVTI